MSKFWLFIYRFFYRRGKMNKFWKENTGWDVKTNYGVNILRIRINIITAEINHCNMELKLIESQLSEKELRVDELSRKFVSKSPVDKTSKKKLIAFINSEEAIKIWTDIEKARNEVEATNKQAKTKKREIAKKMAAIGTLDKTINSMLVAAREGKDASEDMSQDASDMVLNDVIRDEVILKLKANKNKVGKDVSGSSKMDTMAQQIKLLDEDEEDELEEGVEDEFKDTAEEKMNKMREEMISMIMSKSSMHNAKKKTKGMMKEEEEEEEEDIIQFKEQIKSD